MPRPWSTEITKLVDFAIVSADEKRHLERALRRFNCANANEFQAGTRVKRRTKLRGVRFFRMHRVAALM